VRPAPKITPKLVVAIVEQARIEAAEETALRIPPRLAVAVVLAGLIGIGWMVRSTWAQDLLKPATPAPLELPPPSPSEGQVPGTPVPNLADSPAIPGSPAQPIPAAALPEPTELLPSGQPAAPGAIEDPEKIVQAFVAQNRKVAESQLKNLKSEAERLRARLQKVEAGVKRWESLLAALDQSETTAKDLGGPSELEPSPARRQLRPKSVASEPVPASSKPAPSAAASPVDLAPAPSEAIQPRSAPAPK
jgi:hypothetical protein